MKHKNYESFKESGITLIGKIPKEWKVKKLKHISNIILGKMLTPTDNGISQLKPYLRAQNLSWFKPNIDDVNEMWFTDVEVQKFRVNKNDLLVSEGGEVGRSCIWSNELDEVYIQNSVNKVEIQKGVPKYFLYHFYTFGMLGYFDAIINRVSIGHLTREKIKEIPIIFPSVHEQLSIAAFLDGETARIDALIEKKKKLSELLKEKRTALITRAVTKGLNKEVKMKPSGIEWLGEIPEHWEVKRLKEVSTINDDVLPENTDPEYQICYVDIGNVDKNDGIIGKEELVFGNAPSRARRVVKDGDVIVSTVRTYLRAIAPIVDPEDNLIVSTGFAVVRPKLIDKGYLSFSLRSFYFINRVVSFSTGVSYPAITSTILAKIKIPIPPSLNEQAEISNYLNLKIECYNNIEKKVQNLISKLQEYRTALISAAVTGKIRVG